MSGCDIRKDGTLLFCWLSLLVAPAGYTIYCYALFALICAVAYMKRFRRIRHWKTLLSGAALALYFVFTSRHSRYDMNGVIVAWSCLYVSSLLNDYSDKDSRLMRKSDYLENALWTLCLLTMVIRCLTADRIGDFNEIVFYTAVGDKNMIAWTFFVFCLYAQKRGYRAQWLFLAAYMSFFSKTRSVYLMIILYVATVAYVKVSSRKIDFTKRNYVFYFFIVGAFCSIAFSYLWVSHFTMRTLDGYKESLNDGANRMRFAANIYAWENLLQNKALLCSGYGEDVKRIMGIAFDENTLYLGVRLIAPENSALSCILYLGWLPGIAFLWCVGKYMQKYCFYENLPYIIPILVNSMLIPTLRGSLLIIWLFLVSVPRRPRRRKRLLLGAERSVYCVAYAFSPKNLF